MIGLVSSYNDAYFFTCCFHVANMVLLCVARCVIALNDEATGGGVRCFGTSVVCLLLLGKDHID